MSDPEVEVEPWEALLSYVGGGSVDPEFVRHCWEVAVELVDRYVGIACGAEEGCPSFPHVGYGHGSYGDYSYGRGQVPAKVLTLCYVQVGSELFARKDAPSGITSFADGMPSPVRLARDPMTSVYPILRRFVGGVFA